jgi:hypothetical protein
VSPTSTNFMLGTLTGANEPKSICCVTSWFF